MIPNNYKLIQEIIFLRFCIKGTQVDLSFGMLIDIDLIVKKITRLSTNFTNGPRT